jgi:outer membrane protein TolC
MFRRTLGIAFATLLCSSAAPLSRLSAQQAAPQLVHELDSLVGDLARHDQRLRAGRSLVDASQARLRAGLPLDALTLDAEVENIPPGTSPLDAQQATARITAPLYRGGRAGAVRTLRTAQLAETEAGAALLQAALTAEYREELVSWLVWRGIEARLSSQDTVLALAADVLTARFTAGTARYLDVLRLRTERLQLARERAEAGTEVAARLAGLQRRGRNAPAVLAQLDSQLVQWELRRAWAEIPGAIEVTGAETPDSLVAQIVSARLAKIDGDASVARSTRGMTIAGMLGVQRFLDGSGFATGPTAGVTIGLPFSLGGAYGREREAIQASRLADSSQAAADLTGWSAEAAHLEQVRTDARNRARLFGAALLAGAGEEREAALASFRAGGLSLLELLDFERALAAVERDRLLTMLEVVTADAALARSALAAFDISGSTSSEGLLP